MKFFQISFKFTHLGFETAVNDRVKIQMLFTLESFQAHRTNVGTFGVVTY